MKRHALTPLGETEMEVLQHVWDLGAASVAEVHTRILDTRRVAYTTVMTVMRNLADKGYLRFEKQGNAYVYSAARQPEEVRGSLLRSLTEKVFSGSPLALVQTLVRTEDLSEAELAALRTLIDSIEDDDADAP
jgi:predicted transcriptional regulator